MVVVVAVSARSFFSPSMLELDHLRSSTKIDDNLDFATSLYQIHNHDGEPGLQLSMKNVSSLTHIVQKIASTDEQLHNVDQPAPDNEFITEKKPLHWICQYLAQARLCSSILKKLNHAL